jgi:hypothetical protein
VDAKLPVAIVFVLSSGDLPPPLQKAIGINESINNWIKTTSKWNILTVPSLERGVNTVSHNDGQKITVKVMNDFLKIRGHEGAKFIRRAMRLLLERS